MAAPAAKGGKPTPRPAGRKKRQPDAAESEEGEDEAPKTKLPAFASEPAWRSPPGSVSHSLCVQHHWPWVEGPRESAHEVGGLVRHRLNYSIAREITTFANARAKNTKGPFTVNVGFLYPGGELLAMRKSIETQDRVKLKFYGIRDVLHLGDLVRDRKTYAPVPPAIKFDFVVGIDCIHFLQPDDVLRLTSANTDKNTRYLFTCRPIRASAPGLYVESYNYMPVEKVVDEDSGDVSWESIAIKTTYEEGFGFIEHSESGPLLRYTASLLDNCYDQPLGDQWLNQRLSAPGGAFDLHIHREVLGQVIIRAAFVHNSRGHPALTTVPRLAALGQDRVLVDGGVCRAALESASTRADRTVWENVASVNNYRNAVRLAVMRSIPEFVSKLPGGPMFIADTIAATAHAASHLSMSSLPRLLEGPARTHPAVAYAELKYASLGTVGAAVAARIAQPSKNRVDAAANAVDAVFAGWAAAKTWWSAPADLEGELSVVAATVAAARRVVHLACVRSRRLLSLERKVVQAGSWFLKRIQWDAQLAKVAIWLGQHPRLATGVDVAYVLACGLSTAVWEETVKRAPGGRLAAGFIGAAMALWESMCYALVQGEAYHAADAAGRLILHVGLAMIPYPVAVVLHALVDANWRYQRGETLKGFLHRRTRFAHMMEAARTVGSDGLTADSDTREDLRHYLRGAPLEVGRPLEEARPLLPNGPTDSTVTLAGRPIEGVDLDRLQAELDAAYDTSPAVDSGRFLAFPNDCALDLLRPCDHPLILLEIDRQRLDVPCANDPDEAAVREACRLFCEAAEMCGMSYQPLDTGGLLDYIWESNHTHSWKLDKTAALLNATADPAPGSLFPKRDEMLLARFDACLGNEGWAYVKTRPISPMDEWQVIDFAWTKPLKKALGSTAIKMRLDEEDPRPFLTYQFLEKPRDIVVTRALADIGDFEVRVLDHGDDSVAIYPGMAAATQRDAVSADKSERSELQAAIVQLANRASNNDPLVEQLTSEHYVALNRPMQSKPKMCKELDVVLRREGSVKTITGEPATALKNGLCIGMVYARATQLFRRRRLWDPRLTAMQLRERLERCVDLAAADLGMDMPMGPGSHVQEMTFLGGGFACTADAATEEELPEYAWVSLGVLKAMYAPTQLFQGTLHEQARAWSWVVSRSLGGCPAAATFAAMAGELNQTERESFEDAARERKPGLRTGSGAYCVSWESWADMLMALCSSCGHPQDREIQELVDEFEEKAVVSNPSLEFDSSWGPFFVARFGKRAARLAGEGGGPHSL